MNTTNKPISEMSVVELLAFKRLLEEVSREVNKYLRVHIQDVNVDIDYVIKSR